jgi:hypothetical protein
MDVRLASISRVPFFLALTHGLTELPDARRDGADCEGPRRLEPSYRGFGTAKQRPLNLVNELVTMLLSPDEGHSGHCSCRVARWNAYRLTLRFPARRAAVTLGGWSARPLVLSSGI